MVQTEKARLVEIIRDVIRRQGYEGASLAEISKATGLGRSSLYHHFPGGKDEMVCAALQEVGAIVEDRVVSLLDKADLPPADRLQAVMLVLSDYYHGGLLSCICAVLALTAPAFRPQAQDILVRLMSAFSRLAQAAGRDAASADLAAEIAMARIQGGLVLTMASQDQAPFMRAIAALPEILGLAELSSGVERLVPPVNR